MRFAFFSDIQGNRQAWEAVLADMTRLGAETMVSLGGVVGHGPAGKEVLRAVRQRTEHILRGEMESAVAGLLKRSDLREVAGWARRQLGREARNFLAKQPVTFESERVRAVTGMVLEPERFKQVDDAEAAKAILRATKQRFVFVGSGSIPVVYQLDESGAIGQRPAENFQAREGTRFLVVVGSVGDPAKGQEPRARYVIHDDEMGAIFFREVEFDVDAYRRELVAAGRPLRPWLQGRVVIGGGVRPQIEPAAAPARLRIPGETTLGAAKMVAARDSGPPARKEAGGSGNEMEENEKSRRKERGPENGEREENGNGRDEAARAREDEETGTTGGRARAPAALGAALVILTGVGAFLALKGRDDPADERVDIGRQEAPVPERPGVASAPSSDAPAEDTDPEARGAPPADAPAPEPAGTSESAIVAETNAPAPAPDPPEPAPKPEPAAAPTQAPAPQIAEDGPIPIPRAPANLAGLTPPHAGLLFYLPLDEPRSAITAIDKVGGRELDVAGGLPGALGRVGMAVLLDRENDSEALVSNAVALPAVQSLAISMWIKRPDPPASDGTIPGEEMEAAAAADESTGLFAIKEYCEVRLEGDQVVADLDGQGEVAAIDFPHDYRWHHVFVENTGGTTTIWIDHRAQSSPVAETLAPPPAGGGIVVIGGAGAHLLVDEVALWNRPFTADERCVLYRQGRLDMPILRPAVTVARWGFDEEPRTRVFADTRGRHPLGSYKGWTSVDGIAPNPAPLTGKNNSRAAQVWHLAERPDGAGAFQLRADTAFTYEGWMKLGERAEVTLGATTPQGDDTAGGGWRLEARPGEGTSGSLVFLYEDKEGGPLVEAAAQDLSLYDELPHYFVAVWNPHSSPTFGSLELLLDGVPVASAGLAKSDIRPAEDVPFRIEAEGAPVVVDELRFSEGVLEKEELLIAKSAGVPEPVPEGAAKRDERSPRPESVMERLARESQERREREKKEREQRRKEDEMRRNTREVGKEGK